MKGLEIYLKSGAVISADATDLVSRRSTVTGDLTEVEWTTPQGAKRKLHFVNVGEVAALVVIA